MKEFEGFLVLVPGDLLYPICPLFDSDHGELLGDRSFLCYECASHQCCDGCLVALLPWSGHH